MRIETSAVDSAGKSRGSVRAVEGLSLSARDPVDHSEAVSSRYEGSRAGRVCREQAAPPKVASLGDTVTVCVFARLKYIFYPVVPGEVSPLYHLVRYSETTCPESSCQRRPADGESARSGEEGSECRVIPTGCMRCSLLQSSISLLKRADDSASRAVICVPAWGDWEPTWMRAKRVPWVFGFLLGQREQRTIENSAWDRYVFLSLHPNSPKPRPKHALRAAVPAGSPSAAKFFPSDGTVQMQLSQERCAAAAAGRGASIPECTPARWPRHTERASIGLIAQIWGTGG
ncbi:hypothetical protein EYF80_042266 [Liparis tanakae]|uniref:Uncharacterized protein n=1 Tax=Liparis tanakae TaxID=230148 RepID=A0A4Z2G3D2_9TELE|nr:hypothetical protein EYF80_042266 [Liparis tanakae]